MTGSPKIQNRPYNSTKRDRARAANADNILAAAGRVLARAGWPGFTLQAVAGEAGVTRLTVYNHFGNRRALLEALFDQKAMQGGLGDIASAVTRPDPLEALDGVVTAFCQFWQSSAGPMHAMAAESAADPEFAQSIRDRNARRRHLLAGLVSRLPARPAPEAARLTETLFALTSFTFHAELSAGSLGPDQVRDAIIHLARAAVTLSEPE